MPRRLINHDRLDPDALQTLQNWLQTCDKHHLACRRSISGKETDPEPLLPTRILDVGTEDASCRLRIVDTHCQHGSYLALSHCWGGTSFCMTLHNYQRYHDDGFALEELPTTLRDAVKLTRALGFQYIWIDSLCILQDSVDDWNRESQAMGAAYENAYCTIAATLAPDSDTGFLRGQKIKSVAMPCDLTDATKGAYFITAPYQPEFKQVGQARLNHRGWVVQERLLSRRTMHIAHEQIF